MHYDIQDLEQEIQVFRSRIGAVREMTEQHQALLQTTEKLMAQQKKLPELLKQASQQQADRLETQFRDVLSETEELLAQLEDSSSNAAREAAGEIRRALAQLEPMLDSRLQLQSSQLDRMTDRLAAAEEKLNDQKQQLAESSREIRGLKTIGLIQLFLLGAVLLVLLLR